MRVRSDKDLKLAMNSAIRKPPRVGITPQAAQNVMRPIAGPKLNPKPIPAVTRGKPAVAQTKTVGSAPTKTVGAAQLSRTRVAPPVFRPELRPTCLQAKNGGPPQLKDHRPSPKMNHPQADPKAVQTRRTLNHHPSKQQPTHKSPAPTVPKVLQTKKAAPGPTINTPTRASAIQLRRPDGFYRLRQDANLRALRNYKVIAKLREGQIVYAKNNHETSNFKAGTHWYSPTNEHTWVEWENPADTEYYLRGWIEDSKLEPATHILQEQFRPGDKLYGRHETRYSIIRSGEDRNAPVREAEFNIIDDVNTEIRRGLTMRSPAEARGFAEFAEGRMRQSAETIRIRKMCKLGLAYVTQNRFIHFMLDGLDPDEIYREAVNARMVAAAEALGHEMENELPKRCTGAEMRALMRQRLFDTGSPGGKNHGIDLQRVKFYLCYAETPAPWSRQAIPMWRQAWLNYSRYRAGRAGAERPSSSHKGEVGRKIL